MDELRKQLQELALALADFRQRNSDLSHAGTELKALELLQKMHGGAQKNKEAPSPRLAELLNGEGVSDR